MHALTMYRTRLERRYAPSCTDRALSYLVYMTSGARSSSIDEPDDGITRVGIRDLRLHLSEYLRRAEAGETIEVTDRGRPLSRIVPVPKGEMTIMERAIADGLATPPAWWPDGPRSEPPMPRPRRSGERRLSEVLLEMRDEERF